MHTTFYPVDAIEPVKEQNRTKVELPSRKEQTFPSSLTLCFLFPTLFLFWNNEILDCFRSFFHPVLEPFQLFPSFLNLFKYSPHVSICECVSVPSSFEFIHSEKEEAADEGSKEFECSSCLHFIPILSPFLFGSFYTLECILSPHLRDSSINPQTKELETTASGFLENNKTSDVLRLRTSIRTFLCLSFSLFLLLFKWKIKKSEMTSKPYTTSRTEQNRHNRKFWGWDWRRKIKHFFCSILFFFLLLFPLHSVSIETWFFLM